MNNEILKNLIVVSGVGHITLSVGSLLVPMALKWKLYLEDLQPLLRQMFWTYAAYILMINLWFGIICLFGTNELLADSFLAKSVHLMISIYWLIRIGVQFFYFDRTFAPKGLIYTIGECSLVVFFIMFAVIHAIAFYHG